MLNQNNKKVKQIKKDFLLGFAVGAIVVGIISLVMLSVFLILF